MHLDTRSDACAQEEEYRQGGTVIHLIDAVFRQQLLHLNQIIIFRPDMACETGINDRRMVDRVPVVAA